MTFGEKLQQCRKHAGLSQEELAERLNVSRQAVSKWERDSGYPETEKLIRMSQLFHVTLDYLLLEEPGREGPPRHPPGEGLYVSRELMEGFFLHRRRRLLKLGLGAGLLVGGLSLSFWDGAQSMTLFMVLLICAVLLFASARLTEDPYRRLYRQPLTFDPAVYRDLNAAWADVKRRLHRLTLAGIALIAVGVLLFPLLGQSPGPVDDVLLGIGMLLAGVGTFLCVYMTGMRRAYRVLRRPDESEAES